VLLTAMADRSASARSRPVAGWLRAVRAGLSQLMKLRPARPTPEGIGTLPAGALKDIGLARSDLPAIRTGQFFSDPTRRQR
jgi:hypothetical protein